MSFVEFICQCPTRNQTAQCTVSHPPPLYQSLILENTQSGSARGPQHGYMQKCAVSQTIRLNRNTSFSPNFLVWNFAKMDNNAQPHKVYLIEAYFAAKGI